MIIRVAKFVSFVANRCQWLFNITEIRLNLLIITVANYFAKSENNVVIFLNRLVLGYFLGWGRWFFGETAAFRGEKEDVVQKWRAYATKVSLNGFPGIVVSPRSWRSIGGWGKWQGKWVELCG